MSLLRIVQPLLSSGHQLLMLGSRDATGEERQAERRYQWVSHAPSVLYGIDVPSTRAYILLIPCLLLGCSDETRPAKGAEATSAGPVGSSGSGSGVGGAGGGMGSGGSAGSGAGGGAPSGWTALAPITDGPTQENAVVALDGEVVIVGGFDEQASLLDDVEAYDPNNDTWRALAVMPDDRHHVNAAVVGGKLYVVGSLAGLDFSAQPDVYIYDPAINGWSFGTPMPAGTERGGAAVGVIGSKIYVAGGYRSGSVGDHSAYDTVNDSWETLAAIPDVRDHLVGAAIGGELFVIGGRTNGIANVSDRVDVYDPDSDSWTPRSAMPTARAGCMAAALDGRIFVFGGEGNGDDPSGVFGEVEAYDPATDSWEAFDAMRTPRHGTGATTIGDVIYIPGGAPTQAFGAVSDNESFVP